MHWRADDKKERPRLPKQAARSLLSGKKVAKMLLLVSQQATNSGLSGAASGNQKLCLEPSDVLASNELSHL